MKKAHSKKLSIPCFFEEPKAKEPIKLASKVSNKYKSTKNSPNSSIISKVKKITTCTKTTSRQLSPRVFASCTNSPPKGSKSKVPPHVVKKKKLQPKKTIKVEEKLSILKGDNLKYAPKIYENQLFLDVYDEFGRHDRLMEITDSLISERGQTPIIIFDGAVINDVAIEGPRPPGNSFEETCQDSDSLQKGKMNFDLFAKLEQMAKNQREFED